MRSFLGTRGLKRHPVALAGGAVDEALLPDCFTRARHIVKDFERLAARRSRSVRYGKGRALMRANQGVHMLPRKGKPGCEGADRHAFYV